jgi:hypothetical protein
MSEDDEVVSVGEERTAVRIGGEGVGQSQFEGRGVPPSYRFLLDIRRGHLHKMCRTFQTSAHAFSCSVPSLFGHALVLDAGPVHPTIRKS